MKNLCRLAASVEVSDRCIVGESIFNSRMKQRMRDPGKYVGSFVRKEFKGYGGWFDGEVMSFE